VQWPSSTARQTAQALLAIMGLPVMFRLPSSQALANSHFVKPRPPRHRELIGQNITSCQQSAVKASAI